MSKGKSDTDKKPVTTVKIIECSSCGKDHVQVNVFLLGMIYYCYCPNTGKKIYIS